MKNWYNLEALEVFLISYALFELIKFHKVWTAAESIFKFKSSLNFLIFFFSKLFIRLEVEARFYIRAIID